MAFRFERQAESDFGSLKTLKEINEKLVSYLKGLVSVSDAELCQAAESFFNKLKIADEYQPKSKFNGDVLLFRALDNFVAIGNDYGLKEVSCVVVRSRVIIEWSACM